MESVISKRKKQAEMDSMRKGNVTLVVKAKTMSDRFFKNSFVKGGSTAFLKTL
jgi:hypothetical protein